MYLPQVTIFSHKNGIDRTCNPSFPHLQTQLMRQLRCRFGDRGRSVQSFKVQQHTAGAWGPKSVPSLHGNIGWTLWNPKTRCENYPVITKIGLVHEKRTIYQLTVVASSNPSQQQESLAVFLQITLLMFHTAALAHFVIWIFLGHAFLGVCGRTRGKYPNLKIIWNCTKRWPAPNWVAKRLCSTRRLACCKRLCNNRGAAGQPDTFSRLLRGHPRMGGTFRSQSVQPFETRGFKGDASTDTPPWISMQHVADTWRNILREYSTQYGFPFGHRTATRAGCSFQNHEEHLIGVHRACHYHGT